jgi:hypothetical protein
MNRRSSASAGRALAGAGWILASVSLVALGVLWALDRTRPRETPRWDTAAFPALHRAPGAAEGWRERWVVAVHPGCPHCRVSLTALTAARDRSRAEVLVTALVVDEPDRPPDQVLASLPADEACWDSRRIWRDRWRHRVYGEVLCFDAEGEPLRQLAPFDRVETAVETLEAEELTDEP